MTCKFCKQTKTKDEMYFNLKKICSHCNDCVRDLTERQVVEKRERQSEFVRKFNKRKWRVER